MKAAVIDSLKRGPQFADFDEPVVTGGETLVEVTAAGLHPIVRMLASGEHYGSQGMLPMIPGIDGTGRSADGTRVYFGGVRPPYGPMAQRAAAPFVLPLPDGLDEVTAAAIINPGNGAWLALTRQAALQPGETVLVLGATGVSGRIAVALATRMGAGRVIAAGRNRAILDGCRDGHRALGGPDDAAALAEAAGQDGIHVIIDYLWGQPTEAAIAAITRRGLAHAAPRVRLVEVGQMAGPVIALPADVLRSSGLEVLGSGPGTIPLTEIIGAIPEFMAIAATGDLPIDIDEMPLAEVEAAWHARRRPADRPAALTTGRRCCVWPAHRSHRHRDPLRHRSGGRRLARPGGTGPLRDAPRRQRREDGHQGRRHHADRPCPHHGRTRRGGRYRVDGPRGHRRPGPSGDHRLTVASGAPVLMSEDGGKDTACLTRDGRAQDTRPRCASGS